jgi:hypothetical protein
MRFRLAVACAALVSLSCASGGVRLEHYRAAYSTHFQGVPDQAEACALLRNRSARPVEWIELRLRTRSHFGGDAVIRSRWIYRGHVAPGASLAVRFVRPPIADEIALSHVRSGSSGPGPEGGRPLLGAKECSDDSLHAVLEAELAGRTAPDIELIAAERAEPDADGDGWVAGR